MTSGLEAVGDVATGALVSCAVEPRHGEDGEAVHGACANCGTALVGNYCHACGQNSHIHRSLAGFGHDLLHGVFHFEGKIWDTLPLLFFKPGELTRRYIHGERAKFVSPLAMFLFSVFLMFAVVSSLAGTMHTPEVREADKVRPLSEIKDSREKNKSQIDALEAQIKEGDRADKDTSALEAKVEKLEQEDNHLSVAEDFLQGVNEGAGGTKWNINTGIPPLDHGLKSATSNPDLFLYRLQSSAYKYSWLLIPISTPMVWLLFFWKRQYKLYDHLVFVTFSLIFMSLLVTIGTVAGAAGLSVGFIATAAATIVPLHLYRQLRGAYPGSRLGAVVRTAILLWFAFWALLLYGLILLTLGVMH